MVEAPIEQKFEINLKVDKHAKNSNSFDHQQRKLELARMKEQAPKLENKISELNHKIEELKVRLAELKLLLGGDVTPDIEDQIVLKYKEEILAELSKQNVKQELEDKRLDKKKKIDALDKKLVQANIKLKAIKDWSPIQKAKARNEI
jgi:SMC interacting uncharacterized protein involved in chromosome segregation